MKVRMILIVIAMVSALVSISFAESLPPSAGSMSGPEHVISKPVQSDQTTAQKQHGTEQNPLVISVLPSIKSKAETEFETRERNQKSANERWITWATVWLAIVTTLLAIFTAYLWDATRKLAKSAEETAKRQLRAFIFGKGFNFAPHIWDEAIKEYVFWVAWENVGLTPGIDVCNWIEVKTIPKNQEQKVVFTPSHERRPMVMGPRATAQTGYITVPLETMMQRRRNEIQIYVWSRVEYRDIFDNSIVHHHEQCASVELIHDPSAIPPEGHPPYVTFSIYGAQNSTA